MKSKVKILFAMVAVLLCLGMAACGAPAKNDADSSLEGTTWQITSITTTDGKFDGDDVAAMLGGEVSYEFKANGVVTAHVGDNAFEATYKEGDGTLSITSNGTTSEMVYDGETITFDNEAGACVMTMK
ncbi:MAG: hypothetical protein RR398_05690 [Clostridia bacterium]